MRRFTVLAALLAAAAIGCNVGEPQSPSLDALFASHAPSTGGDCPPVFTLTSTYGNPADRNNDGLICTKTTRGGQTVTIDNNATRPGRKP